MSHLIFKYDGTTLSSSIIPPTKVAMPSRAELGSPSNGSVSAEDAAAALTITGWRPWSIDETDCAQPRLFTGWVFVREMGRSFDQGQFVGPDARIHDVTITDLNAALGFRVISGTDGKRPEETMDARMAWLLASDYVTGSEGTLFEDTGKVLTGLTLPMDATDYRGSYAADVLADLSGRSNATLLNYYVWWDVNPSTGSPRPGLFFNWLDETTMDSTLSISNVLADLSTTCFAPITESRLERTPEETYSDVIVDYANGSVLRTAATTAAAFVKRGTRISRPHTGKLTTAQAQGDAWLLRHSVETDRITTTIHVPASKVGLVQAGQRMQVRFSHLPGYETATWMRVVACEPKAVDDLAQWYDVALELVAPQGSGTLGFHQVVLGGSTWTVNFPGFGVQPGGGSPVPLVWTTAIQDTDGYSGTPGNWQTISHPSSVTIPAGLGGTYRAGFEYIASGTAWWLGGEVHLSGHPIPPHAVPYVPGHVPLGPTTGLCGAAWTATYNLRVNGASVATCAASGAGAVTESVTGNIDASGLTLADGDVVSLTLTWDDVWAVSNFNNALNGGVLFLTQTAGPGISTTGDVIPTVNSTITTTDPTATDDGAHGYAVGSAWINTATGHEYVLVDDTTGAAVWVSTTAVSVFSFSTTDGTTTVDPTTSLTFVGATLADLGGGDAEVTLAGGAAIVVTDEGGSPLTSALASLDFVGAGVTATATGDDVTVTIPGGGGLPWYNVMTDGTCVGDGATDDTAAIQNAIDTATASGTQSATLYFPPGTYLIGAALVAATAQIIAPSVLYSNPQITIRFVGAARPPYAFHGPLPTPGGYSILKSTLTGGAGGQAVISGGGGNNNVSIVVEDLICLAPDNPSYTFWDLRYTQGGAVLDSYVGVAPWSTCSQPTHSNAYGVKLPGDMNSNYIQVSGLRVGGYYTGLLMGELAVCRGLIFGPDIVAVEFPFYNHASLIVDMHQTGCTYGIRATGLNYSDVLQYDAEHVSGGWQQTLYDLDDASNYLHGNIRWFGVLSGVGADHSFLVNGGSNATHQEIGSAAATSFAVPSIGYGTAAAGAASTAVRSDATIAKPTEADLSLSAVTTGNVSTSKHGFAPVLPNDATKYLDGTGAYSVPPGGAGVGALLIADVHSTPLIFDDLLQNDEGDDLLYADA